NILGRGFKNILMEKLGVCRPAKPLLSALELRFLRQICSQHCEKHHIPWHDLFESGAINLSMNYSQRNQFLAHQLGQVFLGKGLGPSAHSLLKIPTFKARSEIWPWRGGEILFIGSHNLDGIRKMAQSIKHQKEQGEIKFPLKYLLLSFSQRPKEEIAACLRLFLEYQTAEKIILTNMAHPKAASAEILQQLSQELCGQYAKGTIEWRANTTEFWHEVDNQQKSILVSGSYYFVGEIQKSLYRLFGPFAGQQSPGQG
ncbi:MAG: hypothetical protein WCG27_13310, partial [Pseudomonadota bacterium]